MRPDGDSSTDDAPASPDNGARSPNPEPRAGRRLRGPLSIALVSAGALWLAWFLLPVGPPAAAWKWALGREVGRPLPGALAVWLALAPLLGLFSWLITKPLTARVRAALLAIAVLAGVGLHDGVQLAEGRFLEPLERRLWQSGHSEFLYIAMLDPAARSLADLTRRYDQIVAQKGWFYPPSKPPGCLMVYRAFVAVADGPLGYALDRVVYGGPPPQTPRAAFDRRIAALAFVLFPLFTAFTALPLYLLARLFASEQAALLAALLNGLTPSFAIVALHLDNALYPLVGVTAVLLMAEAARRAAWPLALVAGVLLSLGVFVSFSLVPLGMLAAALPLVWSLRGRAGEDPAAADPARRPLEPAALAVVFAAAAVATHAALALALGYDVRTRLNGAVEFHRNWWSGDGRDWRLGNLIQLAVWVGPPVMVAFVAQVGASAGAFRSWDRRAAFSVAAAGTLACMAVSGTAKSEVMRLWEFFVPLIVAVAAARIWDVSRALRDLYVPVLLATQVAFTLSVHAHRSP